MIITVCPSILIPYFHILCVMIIWRATNDLRPHVGDVDAAAVPCGLGRAIGNKVSDYLGIFTFFLFLMKVPGIICLICVLPLGIA
jgi:hypothetical protein